MNMKRIYEKPEMAMTDIQPTVLLQASVFVPKPGDEYTGDEAGADERDEAVDDGVWGDLW